MITLESSKSDVVCPVNNEFEAVLSYDNDVHIFARFKHGDGTIGLKGIIPKYGFDLVCGHVRMNCHVDVSGNVINLIHNWY